MEETQIPAQNPVSETPVLQIEQAPPVSTPINPPADGPKFSKGLIIGIIFIFLLVGSGAAWYYFKPPIQNINLKPTIKKITEKLTPAPTFDPTLDWKIFTEKRGRYTLKYPPDFLLKEDIEGNNDVYYVTLKKAKEEYKFSSGPKEKVGLYASFATGENVAINGITWLGTMSSQYCDVSNCSATAPGYYIMKNDFYVGVNQSNKINDKSSLKQILSTFKFTDANSSPTPTCMKRPACLDATPRCMIAEPASGWCP